MKEIYRTRKWKIWMPCLMICLTVLLCSCEQKDSVDVIRNDEPTADVMIYRNWQETIQDKEIKRLAKIRHESYDSVMDGFRQKTISEDVQSSNATQEYRIVYDIAKNRYEYYSLKVFPDGTGKFQMMINEFQTFKEGSIVLDESKDLSEEEVNVLLLALQENDFGNMPTVQSKDNIGKDGRTIHIEGYQNEKTHFISVWMPSEEDGVKKIYRAFEAFGDSFKQ